VGDFTLNWDTQQYKCWISQIITFSLILALQIVNVYWLFLILRIAYRLITTNIAEDVRSENEDSEDEISPVTPIEETKKNI
jgi:acyl-CoA-dependent ceramide synthase